MPVLVLVAACTLLGAAADVCFKSSRSSLWLWLLGVAIYAVDAGAYGWLVRKGMSLARFSVLYGVACAVGGVAVGVAYREPLGSKQIAGLLLGLCSIALLL